MHTSSNIDFPRAPLWGAAAVIAITLIVTAGARSLATPAAQAPAAAVMTRDLLFVDRPEGGVAVYDAQENRQLDVLALGGDGFVRGVLRSIARERRGLGLGGDTPVRLAVRSNGGLTLEDPATGRLIHLTAFGPTNTAAFARFLAAPDAPQNSLKE